MDLKLDTQIPFIDFTKVHLEKEGDGWKYLCHKVREACEGYGCFQVAYDKVPLHLREEMFMALKDLFDLPDETKKKYSSSKSHVGYCLYPSRESFLIPDAAMLNTARAFTNLMWPEGNPGFCQTLNSTSRKMLELELLIRKMIFESFGVEKYYDSNVANSRMSLRLLKYKAPPSNASGIGVATHTDKGILTILCQDVQGLEVISKKGNWFQVIPSEGTFTVFVGNMLKAWSNGRFHAAEHRVMMSGDTERYSYGLFVTPKPEAVVEVPQELVDKEHPLLFRPFSFKDFISYCNCNNKSDNVLENYAGV